MNGKSLTFSISSPCALSSSKREGEFFGGLLRLPEGNRSQRAIDRPVRSQLTLVQGHLVDRALAKAYVLVLLDRSQHPLPPAERTHPSQGQVRGELPFFRWEVERHQRGLDRFAQLFEPLSAEPDP